MQKLFLTICFLLQASVTNAALRPVSSPMHAKQMIDTLPASQYAGPNYSEFSREDWIEFFQDRIAHGIIENIPLEERDGTGGVTSVIEANDSLVADNKSEDSLFEKMYQSAMEKANITDNNQPLSQPFQAQSNVNYQQAFNDSRGIPTIAVKIPDFDRVVEVPAQAHIPYYFTDIEVMASGDLLIEETIVLLNNSDFPYEKTFSKYINNRESQKQELDIELLSASINGQQSDYVMAESFNKLFFKSIEDKKLPSGVYEYKFKYVIENNISFYENADELFMNVVGSNPFLISRAAATISFPKNFKLIENGAILEFANTLRTQNIVTLELSPNTFAYLSTIPILPRNGFYIIASFEKNGVIAPDISTSFWKLASAYSDALFAILGFLAILISYYISLKSMGKKGSRQRANIKKTAPMIRLLLKNICDIKSLGAFFLDLNKRGQIDIIKNDDTVLLTKKTENTKKLSKYEKLIVQELFSNKETVLSLTTYNMPKLKKALAQLSKGLNKALRGFVYKLNAKYLLFSLSMFLISIVGIASNHINALTIFLICCIVSAVFSILAFAFVIKFPIRVVNYIIRAVSVIVIAFLFLLLMSFINYVAVFFLFASIVLMYIFSYIFAQRSGLLQNYIKEVSSYKALLENNINTSSKSKDLLLQQANIFALDLEDIFIEAINSSETEKLELLKEIVDIYNRNK